VSYSILQTVFEIAVTCNKNNKSKRIEGRIFPGPIALV